MKTDAFEYIRQTQRFLREQKQEFMNPGDLLVYVNRARREVAGRTQCVRRLTPISGQIVSATVFNGGTTYTAPTVVISPPDFPSSTLPDPNGRQAVATATVVSGQINDIVFNDGGNGYFIPEITIVDPTGSGAQIQPVISPINTLNIGQEVYNFSDIYLGNWPGVDSIHAIKSASVVYAELSLHAADVFISRISIKSTAVSVSVSVRADVLFAIRAGRGRTFLCLPVAFADLSVGVRLSVSPVGYAA